MTSNETAKVMAVLKAAYPSYYKGMSKQDAYAVVALWAELFADEPYELVEAAVKRLIACDTKGFPPVPGQVKEQIQRVLEPEETTPEEAWAVIKKALRNGYYGSQEEFAKLPFELQKLIGSPGRLRELAMMDAQAVETVEGSHFRKAYAARAAQLKEAAKLPAGIKELAERFKMPELTDQERVWLTDGG